ncbi:glycoside hydrolase family 30 protein [Terrimonas alba]|uniref:glycoside hydrolase family 30 protein n=1 Tax=Terrimonas alba TaxID=3349636 RepID=UPI0035F47CB0
MQLRLFVITLIGLISIYGGCSKDKDSTGRTTPTPLPAKNEVDFWLTKGDQSILLQKQAGVLAFNTITNSNPEITVDTTQRYQSVDGFGYTLTSGSATLINNLPVNSKASLLQELFGKDANSISISYLRVSIGASDLSASVYTYDDMPTGQTDTGLTNFSLDPDRAGGTGLIPLLKEILAINPNIKILGSPWTPPVWMKDNGNSIGGSLKTEYYDVYAQYFVKYIQQMKAEGITIDAITPQNEPLHPGNNPSLLMTAEQQRDFIKNSLGPAFQAANISTKIIVYDHNCDKPEYPLTILNDPAAKAFVDGSAFHLYAGDISALSTVRNAHQDKNVYFTEQWTSSTGGFEGDLKWHVKNVIIGSMRNWSRVALEWNLANDPNFGPHTPGGCTQCKGALTISSSVSRNVSYYIIAHASKFVPAGSVRVASNNYGSLYSAAFETPGKRKVLIVLNDGSAAAPFNIKFKGKWTSPVLPANSVATFIW